MSISEWATDDPMLCEDCLEAARSFLASEVGAQLEVFQIAGALIMELTRRTTSLLDADRGTISFSEVTLQPLALLSVSF